MPFHSPGSRRRAPRTHGALRTPGALQTDVGAQPGAWSSLRVYLPWVVCLLLAQGCENDYPIAPTTCDDWCHATERADCQEDESPDNCVSNCEATAVGRRFPRCEPEWIELTDCYLEAPNSAFVCVADHSQPSDSVCLEQRRQANYCVSELTGLCFDHCVRAVEMCGGSLTDCEWKCSSSTHGCDSQQIDLYRCLSEKAIVCGSEESVPGCCEPWLQLLECLGYEGACSQEGE